jgi:muramoyltetrapeptide carboxypeptidase
MRIQVIAPASPFPIDEFERGVARLRQRYDVLYDPGIVERAGYLAGSDARRVSELLRAIEDDRVHAIVAARGGYGATRLLPSLSVASVAAHPKLLIGFSDITALHALWARAGLGSIHGSMVAALGRCDEPNFQRWLRAVEGEPLPMVSGLQTIATGTKNEPACGRLFGGNLSLLSALCGTPYAAPLADCVLFLEDHAERPYRVDRMLTQLQQAGCLERVRAIVLGSFTDCQPGRDEITVEQVLTEHLGGLGIPILSGLPAGHLDDNLELPLGASVEVDARRGTLAFQ